MEKEKNIYEKIAKAKDIIKNSDLKKLGHNSYSNYDYFTPEQVERLVSDACKQLGLLTKFDLNRDELGVYGVLTIIDIETKETLSYTMASAIPEIKATNIAQQLGGSMTYTERYLKQSAFGIQDNSIDFDSQKPTTQKKPTNENITWLTEEQFKAAMNSNKAGIEATLKAYSTDTKKMKKDYKEQLTNKLQTL